MGVAGLDEYGEFGALAVLLVLTVAAMWRRGRNPWTEILLVALAAGFAIYSQRTVPVAAAMLAPLAAAPLQDLLGRRPPVARAERLVVAGGALLALTALAVTVPHTSADPPGETGLDGRRLCAHCRQAPRCSTTGTRAATSCGATPSSTC